MGKVADGMAAKLEAAFAPTHLNVIDETNQHHGHAAWKESGETHFKVEITAAAFTGKSRVERQRLVYATLTDDLNAGVHALALVVKAPGEA
jgi:BolA protein